MLAQHVEMLNVLNITAINYWNEDWGYIKDNVFSAFLYCLYS